MFSSMSRGNFLKKTKKDGWNHQWSLQFKAEAEAEVAYGAPGDLPELWREATSSMAAAQKEQATNPVAYPGDSAESRWRQHLDPKKHIRKNMGETALALCSFWIWGNSSCRLRPGPKYPKINSCQLLAGWVLEECLKFQHCLNLFWNLGGQLRTKSKAQFASLVLHEWVSSLKTSHCRRQKPWIQSQDRRHPELRQELAAMAAELGLQASSPSCQKVHPASGKALTYARSTFWM